jgi:hypothetical protein
MSDKFIKAPEKVDHKSRPGIYKPEGYIEDPEERRRLARELRGSMPDLPTVEEFLRKRRESR